MSEINFKCKHLSITDDPDFGCTLEFSDSEDINNEHARIEDLLHPKDKYLLLQRSYPEDEYENDWYTVESSESDIELSQKDKIIIKLRPHVFTISWPGEQLSIGLNLLDKEFLRLKKILKTSFKERVILIEN